MPTTPEVTPGVWAVGDADVHVRPSPRHGRGLYASRPLAAGEPVARAAALILDGDETAALAGHRISHYLVAWDETRSAVPFGPISMINHDPEPNAALIIDHDHLTVELHTLRAVDAGEELTVDYGPDHPV
ncbi:MAG: SET domain-containing protein-lysine N-methyltransferase [Nitriliruptor sp.]